MRRKLGARYASTDALALHHLLGFRHDALDARHRLLVARVHALVYEEERAVLHDVPVEAAPAKVLLAGDVHEAAHGDPAEKAKLKIPAPHRDSVRPQLSNSLFGQTEQARLAVIPVLLHVFERCLSKSLNTSLLIRRELTFKLFLELLVGRFGRGPQCRIFATKIFRSTNFFLEKFAKSSNRVRAHRPKVRPKVRRVEFPKSPKSGQLRTNDCNSTSQAPASITSMYYLRLIPLS